jgi:hypothetical protein
MEGGMRILTRAEWRAEGERLFGIPIRRWQLICPACGTVQSGQELLDAGVSLETVRGALGYSCIGRFVPGKGCNWTLGGLLRIHELEVIDDEGKKHPQFEMATPEAIAAFQARKKEFAS